ncbi:MAG: CvpA family protein [Candidatus Omnitrophota bacterium]
MTELFQRFNWIDLLVVIVLIRSSYVGFTQGFSWEFFRLTGMIGAVIGTIYFYEYGARLISDYIPVVYPISDLLSFTLFYIVILVVVKILNLFIDRIIKLEVFSALEKMGGLLFGALRGIIFLSLFLITLWYIPIPYFGRSIQERSFSGVAIARVAPFIYEKTAGIFPGLRSHQRGEALLRIVSTDARSAAPLERTVAPRKKKNR